MGRDSTFLNLFSTRYIIIPILIGLIAVVFILYNDFDSNAFDKISWGWKSTIWITLAMLMIVFRQVAYMYRLQILTDGELTWRKYFDVILLWEFVSAVTPTIIGGATIGIYLLAKEKISVGKSTAIILLTAFLDELFFILFAPLFFLIAGIDRSFPNIHNLDVGWAGLGTYYSSC